MPVAARQDFLGFVDLQGQTGAGTKQLNTTTPSGRAMFGMLSVFAEFEREMIVERVRAGMATAKAEGTSVGRPKASEETLQRIRELRAQGMSMPKAARELGCGASLIQRMEAAS